MTFNVQVGLTPLAPKGCSMPFPDDTAMAPDVDIFDEMDLLRRLADDRVLAQEVLIAFAGDVRARLVEIETAVAKRDLAAVRRLAHTLRGSASNVSADALVAMARLVEKSIELGDWKYVGELVLELKAGADRFEAVLRDRGWLPEGEEGAP